MEAFNHPYYKREESSTTSTKNKLNQTIPYSGLAHYGTIPKYTVKKRKKVFPSSQEQKLEQQQTSFLAPYPFFQSPLTTPPSFLSMLVQKWFTNNKKVKNQHSGRKSDNESLHSPVGFMPRSVSLSSVKLEVSPTSNHPSSFLSLDDNISWSADPDRKSNSSKSENVKIPCQKQYYPPCYDYSSTTSSCYYSTSKTASTLSELLCEHYVHQQLMMTDDTLTDDDDSPMTCPSLSPTSTTSSESTLDSAFSCTSDTGLFSDDLLPTEPLYNKELPKDTGIDVPLATFRMFRELAQGDEDNGDNENDDVDPLDDDNNSNNDDDSETKHTPSGKEEALLENSWAHWKEACLTKQWILALSTRPEEGQISTPSSQPLVIKDREPRVNSAHLRMLVAEVNMMRADKIVGPLRPRNYLPKRSDPLLPPPSPLSIITVA